MSIETGKYLRHRGWIVVLFVAACASSGVENEDVLQSADACESSSSAKECRKAAIVAEFYALEAAKAGEAKSSQRYFERAHAAASRACTLGDGDGCEYADELAQKLE